MTIIPLAVEDDILAVAAKMERKAKAIDPGSFRSASPEATRAEVLRECARRIRRGPAEE